MTEPHRNTVANRFAEGVCALLSRLRRWLLTHPPLGGRYSVYSYDRQLRHLHPADTAAACDTAALASAAAYPADPVQHAVVRAVEPGRVVVAVVAYDPARVFRGRPPYHLFAVRPDGGVEELADAPPYCFFGIK